MMTAAMYEIHQCKELPNSKICRQACVPSRVLGVYLAEDEVVYADCCIHKHRWQEDVQEEVCRLNPQPDCNAVAHRTSFER